MSLPLYPETLESEVSVNFDVKLQMLSKAGIIRTLRAKRYI